MSRNTFLSGILLAGSMIPATALSQGHDQAHHADGHTHYSVAVDCSNLAEPPWNGLPEQDRQQMAALQEQLAHLSTPEAARAAGFFPALGDIPGMGVHYVHPGRMMDGVDIAAVDNLMFANIDGEDQLVGAAIAFTDVVDTQEPIPFESELARWHDHPQFAATGQSLHMLHLWFVPSSNGPFAGLNFWLPYRSAGITPPSSCWMADAEDAARIQTVSFALVPAERFERSDSPTVSAPRPDRTELLAELDAAARANDHDVWMAAADRFIADLSTGERTIVDRLLGVLGENQMSSAERDAAGIAQPGRANSN